MIVDGALLCVEGPVLRTVEGLADSGGKDGQRPNVSVREPPNVRLGDDDDLVTLLALNDPKL